jgi:L-arabinonolactonase
MRIVEPDIELIVAAGNLCGETPVWHPGEAALYWIDCEGHEVLRRDEASGEVQRWKLPERVGGITLKQGGGALVTLSSGLYDFDFASGGLSLRFASPQPANVSMHEPGVDPNGRLWVGGISHAMGPENLNPGGAGVYRLEGERLVREIDNVSCANGLAFSPDGRTLYFSDSPTRRCDRARPFSSSARAKALSTGRRSMPRAATGPPWSASGGCGAIYPMALRTSRCGCRSTIPPRWPSAART